MSTPMRSSDFKAVVEPILNTGFDGIYEVRKDEWKAFASEQKAPHNRSFFEEYVEYGFGQAPEITDGAPVTYQAGGVLFQKRYDYKVFGLAFAMTRILVEDGDHVALGSTFSEYLAQAMVETKETRLANLLNRAFNAVYVGGDGSPLADVNHAIANGGVFSNNAGTPSVFSQTSLEQAVIAIRQFVDNRGKKIRVTPKNLILHPSNMIQGEIVLNSALKTGTNFNDINAIKSKGFISGGAHDISRLTSPDAWFITTSANDKKGLKIITRRKMEKKMEGDWETDNLKYKATERYSEGWTDPRGVWCNRGV